MTRFFVFQTQRAPILELVHVIFRLCSLKKIIEFSYQNADEYPIVERCP